jgi:anaerobic selenocysteine-containing dehydrogenase
VVPGLEQLADIDVAKREFHIKHRVMHAPEFGTPDGKAHFVVTPLPKAAAPLTLATVRSEGQFNTIIYEEQDSYRLKAGRDAIFLNREDMAAFGVTDGQRVTIASDSGRMEGTATAFDLPRGSALGLLPRSQCALRYGGRSALEDPGIQVGAGVDRGVVTSEREVGPLLGAVGDGTVAANPSPVSA